MDRLLAALLVLLVPAWASGDEPCAVFTPIGDLPGGSFLSIAHGVSADGTTVVGESDSDSGREAFRWTAATGIEGLGDLPGALFDSRANAVSDDGSVIVGLGRPTDSYSDAEAFRWTAGGGMESLGDFEGGDRVSEATGVSGDGSIVVGYGHAADGEWAFRWTAAEGLVPLSLFDGTRATAISRDGETVLGDAADLPTPGFWRPPISYLVRWTGSTGYQLLGSFDSEGGGSLTAASSDGSIAVGVWFSPADPASDPLLYAAHATRWDSRAVLEALGDPPGALLSSAKGVSGDGSVAVGVADRNMGGEACIWDPGPHFLADMLRDRCGLDLDGWTLLSADGISADGHTIAGTGINPDGNVEAWLVRLPELGSAASAIAAVLVLLGLRRLA